MSKLGHRRERTVMISRKAAAPLLVIPVHYTAWAEIQSPPDDISIRIQSRHNSKYEIKIIPLRFSRTAHDHVKQPLLRR